MNNKDQIIMQDSALTIADSIVTTINSPSLNMAWGLCKNLFGAGMKLREKKALEWVEMIKNNPSIFTEQILKDEQFQDGFVYVFESFLKERNEERRRCYKKFFIDFANSGKYLEYPIETYVAVLSQFEPNDFILLKNLNLEIEKSKYQLVSKDEHYVRKLNNLIRLRIVELPMAGSLKRELSELIGNHFGSNEIQIQYSEFGKRLIGFIIS